MEFTLIIIIAFLAGVHHSTGLKFDGESKRHYIYWNSKVTAAIKDPRYSLHVEMGHFMDIVCPLKLGMTDDPTPTQLFDLYNVTQAGFKSCDPTGGRLIFECSLPDQENKLTIKFQSISPSPFGFRFQECEEYYFLAVKRPSPLKTGKGIRKFQCTEDSERLRIKVGCSHEKEKTVEITTTTPTTTMKTKTFYDRVKEEAQKKKAEKDVVVPEIKPINNEKPQKDEGKTVISSPRTNSQRGDGNGASRTTHFNLFMTSFVTILSLFWFSILNTSS